jgi:phosphate transport system substrate-binding protein
MRISKILSICMCSVLSISITLGCCKGSKDIDIGGSTTMGPLMKKISESYKQSMGGIARVQVIGSLKGISLLLDGKFDIADSSVKIPAAQLWEAQKKGITIKEILIGYDIIVPIVHPSNKVGNLFLGQLGDMYTGLIKDWKDVDGTPGKITVIDRDDMSGTKMVMSERYFESKTVVEGSIKKNCDSNVIAAVAGTADAIGYISKSYYNPTVKIVNINGFSPTVENVEKKYYPLYRELYVYVNEKSYKGRVKTFIEYVIGNKGQEIIKQSGFITVTGLTQ